MKVIIKSLLDLFDYFTQKKILKEIKNQLKLERPITLIDVGAHKGEYISSIKKNFPIKKIYAFEPSVLNLRVLSRNISINKLQDKIKIIQLPLFNKRPSILSMSETTFEEGAAFNSFAKNYKSLGIYKSLSVQYYCYLGV